LDDEEPERLAKAARALGLSHVVITSVTRDDLPDGGASQFVASVNAVRRALPDATIELLIPDFQGNMDSLEAVLASGPEILNHNLETVSRLYPVARPDADYRRSLNVLRHAKAVCPATRTKSGIMLGLGETGAEVLEVFHDLREAGCEMLTVGQYLQPGDGNLVVDEYIPPEVFRDYEKAALDAGFLSAYCGPFVRSSYHAGELMRNLEIID
jgi:lipoic acid synthetase